LDGAGLERVAGLRQAVPELSSSRAGISDLWPRSSPETYADLVERVRNAREEITVFGLARNFYAKDEILPLLNQRPWLFP
jgi:hypothetical protein